MLTQLDDDGEQRILLADFGIARNVDDISGLTTTNMTVGTVAYAAPEQLMGEEIDGRADQYALAATAYHLLTGSQLFPHSNPAVVISRHLNSPPPALADTRPELAALDPVLAAALAKNPDDRFPRCTDFARALAEQPVPGAASSAAPTTPAPASHKAASLAPQPPERSSAVGGSPKRWLTLAIALAVIVLASAVALAWHPWQHELSASTPTSSSQPPAATSSTALPTGSAAPPSPPVARSSSAEPADVPVRRALEHNHVAGLRGGEPICQLVHHEPVADAPPQFHAVDSGMRISFLYEATGTVLDAEQPIDGRLNVAGFGADFDS